MDACNSEFEELEDNNISRILDVRGRVMTDCRYLLKGRLGSQEQKNCVLSCV